VNLSRNALANIDYINYHKASFVTGVEGATIESVAFLETNSCELPAIGDITNGNKQFVGWRAPNDTVYFAGTWFYREAYSYDDITFTAEWTDGFVLKYDGTDYSPVVFKAGDEITLADFPEFAAYKYTAWNVNGETKQPGDKIKPEGNITVSAEFEYIPFKVTIDANGGKFEDGSDKMVFDLRYCDYLELSTWNYDLQKYQMCIRRDWWSTTEWVGDYPTPSRDGYVFRYFYSSDENSSSYAVYNPTSDITFYAKWEKKYTIEYYNGNGDRMWSGDNNYYTETSTTVWITSSYYSENNEDLTGKILVGWKDQDGNVYEPGKYFPISALSELKDLKLSPVFENTDQASSHEGWTAKPF